MSVGTAGEPGQCRRIAAGRARGCACPVREDTVLIVAPADKFLILAAGRTIRCT
jgi:hypothetical protein